MSAPLGAEQLAVSPQSSLRNFLIKTYTEEGLPRPADMRGALAQTLLLIAARLGTTWIPPDAPGT